MALANHVLAKPPRYATSVAGHGGREGRCLKSWLHIPKAVLPVPGPESACRLNVRACVLAGGRTTEPIVEGLTPDRDLLEGIAGRSMHDCAHLGEDVGLLHGRGSLIKGPTEISVEGFEPSALCMSIIPMPVALITPCDCSTAHYMLSSTS